MSIFQSKKQMAVVYHSGHGHTEFFAQRVVEGARNVAGVEVTLLKADDLVTSPIELSTFDGLIWGSPTYFGGVSGPFKSFMDSTSPIFREQELRGKLAAGFTVSSLPSGDKQSTLLSMVVFSMQHGMLWVGNPLIPKSGIDAVANQGADRLGSWTGAMAQIDHRAPADSFTQGDIETATSFGEHFARTLNDITSTSDGHSLKAAA
ncbi:flavodoxin family protein [Cryobacterium mannosilyticum]|uniref:Flavodoxin family protein n=1 Tax=Cryobacterium mannosilyticum TaxID=1259190 RepID=A0A4R8WET7_9MICO|nr:flavodoxin family protein [Cryobacterium mannosilyticum]TFC08078.1 flavodoxin family protein [Cryobacterium mannosilyticum]